MGPYQYIVFQIFDFQQYSIEQQKDLMIQQMWNNDFSIEENIKQLISNCKLINDEQISQEQLFGGLSNIIYKANCKNNKFIIKVYLDQNNTNKIFELNVQDKLNKISNISSKIIQSFKNGHIESQLEGKSLDKVEITYIRDSLMDKIAKTLREFHVLDLNVQIKSQKEVISNFFDYQINMIERINVNLLENKYPKPDISIEYLREIVTFLHNKAHKIKNKISLIHSDVNPGNFIQNEENNKMFIIDFEQCQFGPLQQDIANIFMELCGIDCNQNKFPDYNERCQFYSQQGFENDEISNVDEGVMFQTKITHFWGIWCIDKQLLNGEQLYIDQAQLRLNELYKNYENDKTV